MKKADLVNLTETKKYVTFTLVLLIWELIPTFVIIILFRLKKSNWRLSNRPTDWSIQSSISVRKSVFLDYTSNNNNNNRFEDSIDSNNDYNNINSYQNDDINNNDYENNLLINSNNNNSYLINSYYGSI